MNTKLKNFLSHFRLTQNQEEVEEKKWIEEQTRKLRNGEEIEPPWIIRDPEFGSQSLEDDFWFNNIWVPFWVNLSEEEKDEYAEKWDMDKLWRHDSSLGDYFDKDALLLRVGIGKKYEEQKRRLKRGEEIKPPHMIFKGYLEPVQFVNSPWLKEIWCPFWNKMGEKEKKEYVKKMGNRY